MIVVTPTASGKTLCYNLPVLDAIDEDRSSRALYLFPTKALAQDQLAEFEGRAVAGLIVLKYRGVCYAKYEGVDENFRRVQPVHAVIWKTIHAACLAGDSHMTSAGRPWTTRA